MCGGSGGGGRSGGGGLNTGDRMDLEGVPANKSLITDVVQVEYQTKTEIKEGHWQGERRVTDATKYETVAHKERFIKVQTHAGKSGWIKDIYSDSNSMGSPLQNLPKGFKAGPGRLGVTNIGAHPAAPKNLSKSLKSAISKETSIPKGAKVIAKGTSLAKDIQKWNK